MKVVVTIGGLASQFGGPSRTVPALCRALANRGLDIELIALSERDEPELEETGSAFRTTVVGKRAHGRQPFPWRREFCQNVVRAVTSSGPVVLYDVGLWLPSNHFVSRIARRKAVPLVVSPRGMLSPWALQVSRWKKTLAWTLYQKRDLKSARLLHTTSEAETQDCRARGLRNPIALVPHGVDIPNQLPERCGSVGGARTLLFLSRLHPIKGLSDLVHAWARVRPAGWRVIVAGPDEGNHRRDLEALISSLGVRPDFEFVGLALDEAKWKLFAAADLFVLPSYSESFGQAVAEALACRVPVITTRATPWQELVQHRCGWWIDTGADSLAAALREAVALTSHERREMGERGESLIRSRYSWESAAAQMEAAYKWLLNVDPQPNCISTGSRLVND